MAVDATPETFAGLVADGNVLVDFWGPRCQPCIALMPAVEALEESYGGRVRLVKVNAPDNRQVCRDLRVAGLPTYLLYRDGVRGRAPDRQSDQGGHRIRRGAARWKGVSDGASRQEGDRARRARRRARQRDRGLRAVGRRGRRPCRDRVLRLNGRWGHGPREPGSHQGARRQARRRRPRRRPRGRRPGGARGGGRDRHRRRSQLRGATGRSLVGTPGRAHLRGRGEGAGRSRRSTRSRSACSSWRSTPMRSRRRWQRRAGCSGM